MLRCCRERGTPRSLLLAAGALLLFFSGDGGSGNGCLFV
jgi:hypothetical protein